MKKGALKPVSQLHWTFSTYYLPLLQQVITSGMASNGERAETKFQQRLRIGQKGQAITNKQVSNQLVSTTCNHIYSIGYMGTRGNVVPTAVIPSLLNTIV